MSQTAATRAIAQKMTQVEPGSPRYEALEIARKFKISWVELGSTLHRVKHKKLFTQWGYESFEAYCKNEIRIKPQTASKLTASYSFLKEEEPALLRRDGIERSIPDIQAVELMKKAKQDSQVNEENYQKIKAMALDEVPLSTLRKEYRHFSPPEPKPPELALVKLMAQANRLADNLSIVQGIPRAICERAMSLVDDIKALIEN